MFLRFFKLFLNVCGFFFQVGQLYSEHTVHTLQKNEAQRIFINYITWILVDGKKIPFLLRSNVLAYK